MIHLGFMYVPQIAVLSFSSPWPLLVVPKFGVKADRHDTLTSGLCAPRLGPLSVFHSTSVRTRHVVHKQEIVSRIVGEVSRGTYQYVTKDT